MHIAEVNDKGNYSGWSVKASVGDADAGRKDLDHKGAEFWFKCIFEKNAPINIPDVKIQIFRHILKIIVK